MDIYYTHIEFEALSSCNCYLFLYILYVMKYVVLYLIPAIKYLLDLYLAQLKLVVHL